MMPPERAESWWAVPCASRAEFDQRAAAQVLRMAASQEGHRLRIWTASVEAQPVRRTDTPEDVECSARR